MGAGFVVKLHPVNVGQRFGVRKHPWEWQAAHHSEAPLSTEPNPSHPGTDAIDPEAGADADSLFRDRLINGDMHPSVMSACDWGIL